MVSVTDSKSPYRLTASNSGHGFTDLFSTWQACVAHAYIIKHYNMNKTVTQIQRSSHGVCCAKCRKAHLKHSQLCQIY